VACNPLAQVRREPRRGSSMGHGARENFSRLRAAAAPILSDLSAGCEQGDTGSSAALEQSPKSKSSRLYVAPFPTARVRSIVPITAYVGPTRAALFRPPSSLRVRGVSTGLIPIVALRYIPQNGTIHASTPVGAKTVTALKAAPSERCRRLRQKQCYPS
jgi:hypothetical protein